MTQTKQLAEMNGTKNTAKAIAQPMIIFATVDSNEL
jgi:hypothetical protein